MITYLLVAVIVFFAVLTQTVTGFGIALVSMSLLVQLLGIHVAAPLVAMVAAVLEFTLLVRHRDAINWRAVWRLSLASVIGIPLGIIALRYVSDKIVLTVLGLVVVAYAVYALITPRLRKIENPNWAFGFGFVAGLLSGAYNTGGPPAVLYGNSQGWSPSEFKSNLQGLFLLNDVVVITGHALSRHITSDVWINFGVALPAIALGLISGFALERLINPAVFRKIVLLLLIVAGLRLILA